MGEWINLGWNKGLIFFLKSIFWTQMKYINQTKKVRLSKKAQF